MSTVSINGLIYKYALERQSSLKEVIPGGHPTGMSYVLLYRTEYKTQKGEKLQTPEILDK